MHKSLSRWLVCLTILVLLLPSLSVQAYPTPTKTPIETFNTPPVAKQIYLPTVKLQSVDCTATSVTGIPELECLALVAVYNSTNGEEWSNSAGWLNDTDVSNWFGVTVTEGHVTSLQLGSNNLSGLIPTQLGDLSNLTFLALDGNLLTGKIPAELGKLTKLYVLDMSSNQLTGNIPPELGNLTDLVILFLYSNQLTGLIPHELGYLTKLVALHLSYNKLTGSIPPELGNSAKLHYLYLFSNQLSGSIPLSFTNLNNLGHMDFRETFLCEPADAAFQAWKATVDKYFGTEEICGYTICLPLVLK